jgi:hypothetical protein
LFLNILEFKSHLNGAACWEVRNNDTQFNAGDIFRSIADSAVYFAFKLTGIL